MYLIYIGPHEAVLVSDDAIVGGEVVAHKGGPAVKFTAEIAQGLLAQGEDSSEDNPQHQPQWRKATAKEAAAADKNAADGDDAADAAKDGNA